MPEGTRTAGELAAWTEYVSTLEWPDDFHSFLDLSHITSPIALFPSKFRLMPDPAYFFIPRLHRQCGRCPEVQKILTGEPHGPVVYFARIGRNIKIGTTTNLRARCRKFYIGLDDILAVVPGDRRVEAAYHHRFGRSRIRTGDRTELFSLDIWLRLYLARCRLSLLNVILAWGIASCFLIIPPAPALGLFLGPLAFLAVLLAAFVRPGWNWQNAASMKGVHDA